MASQCQEEALPYTMKHLAGISHTDRFHPTARRSDRAEGWSFGLGAVFSLGLALSKNMFKN